MDDQKVINLFHKNGFKITTQRLAIYRFILSRSDHPTADQIYQALIKDYPTISLGTIYKTLHLLKELGLIQELGFNEGAVRYDPNVELHINLVCTKCGRISDFDSKKFKSIWENFISDLEFIPKGQRIDVYYECDECR